MTVEGWAVPLASSGWAGLGGMLLFPRSRENALTRELGRCVSQKHLTQALCLDREHCFPPQPAIVRGQQKHCMGKRIFPRKWMVCGGIKHKLLLSSTSFSFQFLGLKTCCVMDTFSRFYEWGMTSPSLRRQDTISENECCLLVDSCLVLTYCLSPNPF